MWLWNRKFRSYTLYTKEHHDHHHHHSLHISSSPLWFIVKGRENHFSNPTHKPSPIRYLSNSPEFLPWRQKSFVPFAVCKNQSEKGLSTTVRLQVAKSCHPVCHAQIRSIPVNQGASKKCFHPQSKVTAPHNVAVCETLWRRRRCHRPQGPRAGRWPFRIQRQGSNWNKMFDYNWYDQLIVGNRLKSLANRRLKIWDLRINLFYVLFAYMPVLLTHSYPTGHDQLAHLPTCPPLQPTQAFSLQHQRWYMIQSLKKGKDYAVTWLCHHPSIRQSVIKW